jgi:uncharacterized protein (DUF1330 family)
MSAYVVGEVEVTDPAAYDEYRKRVAPLVEKYGGRYLVRGGKVEPKEGGWNPSRFVVIEFPSLEQARKWYESDDYAPVLAIRTRASKSRLFIVEGAPQI